MKLSKPARTVAGISFVVLLAAGVYYAKSSTPKGQLTYDTAKVDRGPIVAKVTASGTVSPLVTVQVGSQVSGRIREILVDYNSPVKKGQVVARIDPQVFQAAVEQARANYLAAQGDLTKAQVQAQEAERQHGRAQSLFERKLIPQAELDTAEANAQGAKAQVVAARGRLAQAHAALHQAQVNLTYTDILSPINGIVISRSVDVGQTVAASLQTPTLFLIAEDLRKMQVDTSVAEADIGKLEAGMAATFSVDAYPNERFSGTVRQIRNSPTTEQNVVTYDAVIDVANPELRLKPGMTANVTFEYARKDDVLRVRNAALRFRPEPELLSQMAGGRAGAEQVAGRDPSSVRVWVKRGGRAEQVAIRVGISDGTLTEVVSGLSEGDEVVVDVSSPDAPRSQPSASPRGMRRVM